MRYLKTIASAMVTNVHVQLLIWIGYLLQQTLVKMRATEGTQKKKKKKKDLFLNSSMTYNVTNQMCYFFILCRSTAVRSFETIPESTKIESEIRVIESCSGNTKVKQEKKNTKPPMMMHNTCVLISKSVFTFDREMKLMGRKKPLLGFLKAM